MDKYIGCKLCEAYYLDENCSRVWRIFGTTGIMVIEDYGQTTETIYDNCKVISIVERDGYIEAVIDTSSLNENESKAMICKALLPVLQMTREFCDLIDINYEELETKEVVSCCFKCGTVKYVDVSADSGTAIIKDILNNL